MASIETNLSFRNPEDNRRFGASQTDVRTYLGGIELLAKEARKSTDRRVLVLALRVLAVQSSTIAMMEGRA